MTKNNSLQRYVNLHIHILSLQEYIGRNEMKKLWRESVLNVKRDIYKKLKKLKTN